MKQELQVRVQIGFWDLGKQRCQGQKTKIRKDALGTPSDTAPVFLTDAQGTIVFVVHRLSKTKQVIQQHTAQS